MYPRSPRLQCRGLFFTFYVKFDIIKVLSDSSLTNNTGPGTLMPEKWRNIMYTNPIDILADEALASLVPMIGIIMVYVALKGTGLFFRIHRWVLELIWLTLALTLGSIYGKIVDAYLITVIFTGLVYLAMRIKWTRKWLFKTWPSRIITVVVILGYYLVVYLV